MVKKEKVIVVDLSTIANFKGIKRFTPNKIAINFLNAVKNKYKIVFICDFPWEFSDNIHSFIENNSNLIYQKDFVSYYIDIEEESNITKSSVINEIYDRIRIQYHLCYVYK